MDFSWKIESTDVISKTMVVKYTHDEVETVLNVGMPPDGEDVGEWVTKFAPVQMWEAWSAGAPTVEAGVEGTATYVKPVPPPAPEAPTAPAGNINEEYLRALIFQVLEEIKAAEAPAPAPTPGP